MGRKITKGNPALTRPLTRLGRLGRSFLKRFMYSQMAIRSGFMIAIGKEQPLVKFKIEDDPPSIYWVYRIKPTEVGGLASKLEIPPQFSLSPIQCLDTDEPEYLMIVNAYRVSGLANGLRAEWSVFVRDADNRPRYLVVDARSSQLSMDPVGIITKSSKVIHERKGRTIHTQIGEDDNAFISTITMPEKGAYASSAAEWVSANDHIFWGNGISDQTYYNADLADAQQMRISKDDAVITDSTPWGQLVEPEPIHILILDTSIELVISPWENVDRADTW
ncbi:MAG TPA: hypothetical protein VJ965_01810 [Anaerolineales bacterium]|nr:hypothetical protein [Anaerolineales bacterium]